MVALDERLVLQIVAVGGLAYMAAASRLLTGIGAASAFLLGVVIVASTDLRWLLLLVSLLFLSWTATRFRYAEKEARGVAEGLGGTRRTRNVLANGLPPAFVAVFSARIDEIGGPEAAAIAFASAVAAAAADTLASELGGLSDEVFLITDGRRVPPGTDGGVSTAGLGAALLGAGAVAGLAMILLGMLPGPRVLTPGPASFGIPLLAGFLGCQVDSLLGATLETRGHLTKEEVNFLSITAAAVLAVALSRWA
ncbi:MAG: DUF92 domain-containing protein [Methanobacteriota archaeon]